MARLSATAVAAEAMHVRALALAFLGTPDEVDEALWRGAARASARAWEVFLRTERYAAPLAERLDRAGRLANLPGAVHQVLAKNRGAELMRVLRIRAHLREIGTVASERGWDVILLKTAMAHARHPTLLLDASDIDVLVPEHLVAEVAGWLDAGGAGRGMFTSHAHVAPRTLAGGIPIEVHRTIASDGTPMPGGAWERAVRVAPGLLGLEPVEHAWHLLWHATMTHVDRRGRLRDVWLLSDALRACSAGERAAVRHRTAGESAGPLGDHLEMARDVAAGGSVVERFADVAYARYAFYEIMRRARWRELAEAWRVVPWVFAWQAGPVERRALWRRTQLRSIGGSPYKSVALVERLAPRLGWALRRGIRLVHGAAMSAVALPIAWRIARAGRSRHAATP